MKENKPKEVDECRDRKKKKEEIQTFRNAATKVLDLKFEGSQIVSDLIISTVSLVSIRCLSLPSAASKCLAVFDTRQINSSISSKDKTPSQNHIRIPGKYKTFAEISPDEYYEEARTSPPAEQRGLTSSPTTQIATKNTSHSAKWRARTI
ncbi:hypothetical protein PoB_001884500 [Plakobranchus ocellatus]|uniref:Uncharacterized protein n=1 Tax=Plakobranchus ocellatus TaxID=259542 RepID=A0AAV3ZB08_9GAST|nr:hypothetical protein PoB_001884500 [Plakobranchus ocellatus]